jgi:hypothetical protein
MTNTIMRISLATKSLTIVLVSLFTTHAFALTAIPAPEITILVSSLGNEGDKFPSELTKFWDVLIIEQDSKSIDVTPIIKLIRIDLTEEKEFVFPKMDSWIDKLVKPDPRIALKKAHDFLDQSKINKDFSSDTTTDDNQKETIKNKYLTEIPNMLEVTNSEVLAKNQFKSVTDLLVVLKNKVSQDVSSGGTLKYLILYNLNTAVAKEIPAPTISLPPKVLATAAQPIEVKKTEPVNSSPSLETQQHVKQGMMFITMAKANAKVRSENIKNALAEFDVAVKQEDSQGRCFALAYMNRGLAYWLDKKLNLAEKDLIKASECDKQNPVIFYNLASYYSSVNKSDLALDPLNKALDLGFKDCDILRKDSDLKNLRKMNEFRRALEQHSLFCLK